MSPKQSPNAAGSILLIHNGGFCSLLASLIAESESNASETSGRGRVSVYAWIPPVGCGLFSDEPPYVEGSISARYRAEMTARQAKLFGFREVFVEEAGPRKPRLSVAANLLRAMEVAAEHRCHRVVWPICVGGDLEALRTVSEQAAMISELACLELPMLGSGESGEIRLSVPFADLLPQELDRLSMDLDAPLEACWKPIEGDSAAGAGLPKPELIED